jgi:hypothetical protein
VNARQWDPAFPAIDAGNESLTIREYFAARAPAEPATWFKPRMIEPRPVCPGLASLSDEIRRDVDLAIDCATDPTTAEGERYLEESAECAKRQQQWDREQEIERALQWPFAWADLVLDRAVPQS